MSRPLALLVTLLLVAVGLVAVRLASTEAPGEVAPGPAPARERETTASPGTSSPVTSSPVLLGAGEDEPGGERAPVEDETDSAAALEGDLVGRVVLEDGSPVPGARVLALPVPPGFPGTVDGLAVDDALRAERRTTTTGADGRFALRGVPTGRVLVGVRHDELAPLDVDVFHAPTDTPRDLGDLVATGGVVLEGWVQDPDGAAVEGARVLLRNPRRDAPLAGLGREPKASAELARTAADGRFRTRPLPPGPWRLIVAAAGYPDLDVEGTTWTPGRNDGHVFVLHAPSGPYGIVVGDGEQALEHLRAEAVEVDPASGKERRRWRTPCDAEGRFAFVDLPTDLVHPLKLLVRHERGWLEPLASATSARLGDADVVVTLLPGSWLSFGLRDLATGEPLTEPSAVFHSWAGERLMQSTDVTGRLSGTNEVGRYRLRLVPTSLSPAVAITASDGTYATHYERDLDAGAGETIELGWLGLERRSTLRVLVRDGAEQPVPGATVHAVRADGVEDTLGEEVRRVLAGETAFVYRPARAKRTTDDAGTCTVPYDASEDWWLVASHPGHAPGTPLRLAGSHAGGAVELELLRGAVVRVTVRRGGEPVSEIAVHLTYEYPDRRDELLHAGGMGGDQRWDLTDANGQCVFRNVLAGEHELLVDSKPVAPLRLTESSGFHERTVEAP